MLLSIIIPNYNGRKYLQKNLHTVLSEKRNIRDSEVLIIDDNSSDDSVEYLRKNFIDELKILSTGKNLGFTGACNLGISHATGEFIMLLNNDVKITEPILEKMLNLFDNEIFAVVPSIKIPGKKGAEEGFTVINFENGDLRIDMPNMDGLKYKTKKPISVPHAVAACAIYKRDKLLELDKFDDLFSPYFWEDVDLSFKAIRRSWKILYDPTISVDHQKSKTVKKYYKFKRRFITNLRNRLLCTWLHLDSPGLFNKHYLFLLYLFENARLNKDHNVITGLNLALKMLPVIKEKRQQLNPNISFKELIDKLNIKNYEKDFNNNSVL